VTLAVSLGVSLRESWELRNAAALTLIKAEEQLRQLLETADVAEIVGLLAAFSPARSPGPEWTRTFDPLIERLWTWCDAERLAAVEAEFRGRGPNWLSVANALAPEHGAKVQAQLRRTVGGGEARLPPFTLG
jgi:hypothetical protein